MHSEDKCEVQAPFEFNPLKITSTKTHALMLRLRSLNPHHNGVALGGTCIGCGPRHLTPSKSSGELFSLHELGAWQRALPPYISRHRRQLGIKSEISLRRQNQSPQPPQPRARQHRRSEGQLRVVWPGGGREVGLPWSG